MFARNGKCPSFRIGLCTKFRGCKTDRPVPGRKSQTFRKAVLRAVQAPRESSARSSRKASEPQPRYFPPKTCECRFRRRFPVCGFSGADEDPGKNEMKSVELRVGSGRFLSANSRIKEAGKTNGDTEERLGNLKSNNFR